MKKEEIKKAIAGFLKKIQKLKKLKKPEVIMRKTYRKSFWKKKIIIAILVLVLILGIGFGIFFWKKHQKNSAHPLKKSAISIDMQTPGKVVETDKIGEDAPPKAEIISQGRFKNVEQTVKGKALFVKSGEDIFLRLEDFETLNGQDMHVYLSPFLNLDPNDAIDAGLLKAVSGNINYKLDKSTNLEKYNNVLIWSNRFSAFFGYATLLKGELPPEEIVNENQSNQTPEIPKE